MKENQPYSTIKLTHKALQDGAITVRDLVGTYIKEANKSNPEINAYLEIYQDLDKDIEHAEKLLKEKKATEVTGIPFAIKDNMLMKGREVTGASKILAGHVSTYDATVIKRLRDQGAIILGRANMDEFAMGSTTENSAYGITRNPLDKTRVPGGSSGGSAAAVAMGGAIAALGSDTGGSVRLPAAFCGLVGLKPTYGAVSRYGLMAMASSFDQIGPITHTVHDAKAVFDAIKGVDEHDSTSYSSESRVVPKKNMRIGVPKKFLDIDGIDKDVREQFDLTIEKLRKAGHEIVDVELPHIKHSLSVYYILVPAEVSSNLARYDGIRYGLSHEGENLLDVYKESRKQGFGPEVTRRILLGTYVLSAGYFDAYYYKANTLREIIRKDLTNAFTSVDAIATPTATSPAYKIGEKTSDPLAMYLGDIFTVTANVAGVPALSVPMGMVKRDEVMLPTGIQLMATHKSEDILFALGEEIESYN